MDLYGLKQLIREEVTKQLSQHTLQIGNYFDLSKFSDEQWRFLKMDLRLYAFDNGFDSKVLLNIEREGLSLCGLKVRGCSVLAPRTPLL